MAKSRVRPDVVDRRLDDRIIVVNLESNRIYELNRTAAALWELLQDGVEDYELESRMLERFQVEPALLRGQIHETLRLFAERGLIDTPRSASAA